MSQLSQAPVEVQLKGKVYKVSPLRICDIEEIDSWLRSRLLRSAAMASEGLSQAAARNIIDSAMAQAEGLSMMNKRGIDKLMTPMGIMRVIFVSTRRHHPDVTLDDFVDVSTEEMTVFIEEFMRINAMTKKETESAGKKDDHPTAPQQTSSQ